MSNKYRLNSDNFSEGDKIVFDMPSFCSGDYECIVLKDEVGLYITNNWMDGCINYKIIKPKEMDKRYILLKDLPFMKNGTVYYKNKNITITDTNSYLPTIGGMQHNRFAVHSDFVENNPEWFQLVPQHITCLVVGDAMKFDNGTFMTATLTLSSPIPNEKMGDIRRAIEEVVNDKKQ